MLFDRAIVCYWLPFSPAPLSPPKVVGHGGYDTLLKLGVGQGFGGAGGRLQIHDVGIDCRCVKTKQER